MTALYPFRFEPIFRRYLWGGTRLGDVLNKPIGDEKCAESWEIVDHGEDQSVVQFGPLGGVTLGALVKKYGRELLGSHVHESVSSETLPPRLQNRFPLLLKFLDANQHLSVQVHPDDRMGRTLPEPDLGKTEAWYVMHADPGAKIYAGLQNGVDQKAFERAVETKTTEDVLSSFEPGAGDCVFVEAGTLHAIGSGLLIAEIQQASDTTFRIFDWNRVDDKGVSRPLHIEQGIQATHFQRGPVQAVKPVVTEDPHCETMVDCDKFVLRRWQITEPIPLGGDDCFRILAVTKGSVTINEDIHCSEPLGTGKTMLVPAATGEISVLPNQPSELLEIFIGGNSDGAAG